LIEEIKRFISMVSDWFNLDWIKRYEWICGEGGAMLDLVPDFDRTV
jgi:hypothetical protein